MRRLTVFILVAATLLAAEAAFNWWIDPFGTFWRPAGLDAALRSNCLLSEELVGNRYVEYKLTLFRRRPTSVFVLGSSRTVKISARPGEETFTNLGIPNVTPAAVLHVLRAIPRGAPRQTVYLGVEAFWFNPTFVGAPPNGLSDQFKYVVSASTLRASVKAVRHAPWELRRRWRRVQIGSHCIIGRTDVSIAWRPDGSRLYGYELAPDLYHPAPVSFTTDLSQLDLGYYNGFDSLSEKRLGELGRALDVARARGWRVVGFSLPNPSRTLAFLRANPVVGPRWRELSRLLPAMFHRRGFAWLDLSDVRSVPCAQDAFADAGFHPDAACSQAIRRRLDAAAATQKN